MHVIAGLPRSGSTLLCNLFNQNPRFFASSTSEIPIIVGKLIHHFSTGVEIKGELARDRVHTEDRIRRSIKAFLGGWYHEQLGQGKIVFDKCRAWPHHTLALRELYPDSKVIILVRDLREVFASIEKQHRKTPLLDDVGTSTAKTIYDRADRMFSPGGLIGNPLEGIKDIIDRGLDALFVRFEDLVEYPERTLNKIYCYLLEEPFEHDYENVVNTATDPDHLYLFKFPHKGEGKVEPPPPQWQNYMSDDLALTIMAQFGWFNERFRYGARPMTQRRILRRQPAAR